MGITCDISACARNHHCLIYCLPLDSVWSGFLGMGCWNRMVTITHLNTYDTINNTEINMSLVIICSIFNRYTYWYCVYFIMFSFIILGLTCLLTIYGVLFESGGALGVCFFFYILCFILNFIGAIIICIFGVEESPVLIKELNEVFLGLIYRMDYDDRASRILKIVQEYVRKLVFDFHITILSSIFTSHNRNHD